MVAIYVYVEETIDCRCVITMRHELKTGFGDGFAMFSIFRLFILFCLKLISPAPSTGLWPNVVGSIAGDSHALVSR